LTADGHRCAVVKHAHHPPDLPGKDTARFAAAGATHVVYSGPRSFLHFPGEAFELIPKLPVDVVLVEGYSRRTFGGPRFRLRDSKEVPKVLRLLRAEVELWSVRGRRPRRSRAAGTPTRAFVLLGRAGRLSGKFDRRVGDATVLERELSALRAAGLRPTLVSVLARPGSGVPVLRDDRNAGPLGGLATVLDRVEPPFVLVGGDMPFLDARALREMRRAFDGRTLVPISGDGIPQVLHAVYGRVSRNEVRRLLDSGGGLSALVDLLDARGEVRWWPLRALGERSVTDVDTPAALRRARRAVGRPSALPR